MARKRRAALPDQRAELRALQDLRHQGSEPEYRLGPARGGRRPELSKHVIGRGAPAGRKRAPRRHGLDRPQCRSMLGAAGQEHPFRGPPTKECALKRKATVILAAAAALASVSPAAGQRDGAWSVRERQGGTPIFRESRPPTLSGAYLAARLAGALKDVDSAADFYRRPPQA